MGHHPIEDNNPSTNRSFDSVLNARLSRRSLLAGSASFATLTLLSTTGLTACSGSSGSAPALSQGPELLDFNAVSTSLEDRVSVPGGYLAQVLFAKGDPLTDGVPEFRNDGTDIDFDQRSGDEHDGMWFFGLSETGAFAPDRSDRGILCVNHENIEDNTLHENGVTSAADNGGQRPKTQVDREMNAHGVSCVETRRIAGGQWEIVRNSPYNRRITAFTEVRITGPAEGADLLKTPDDPDGVRRSGTLNNCANGHTPWGTYLTAEENWHAYFRRDDDSTQRTSRETALADRYGIGTSWAYREWDTAGSESIYQRFNATATANDPTTDYRNEPNKHGFITEIDPFSPDDQPRVRTAFGRFSHEGAWNAPPEAGKPLVFYMGDDARNEYIYKFVSAEPWNPDDANGGLATGDKYLNNGTLYVAVFREDGTGEWKPLTHGQNGLDGANTTFAFREQADVLIAARLAADQLGATRMDRPEWATVNPQNREVYVSLTNGSQSARPAEETDPANPRAINPNGHIIRWREANNDNASTRFTWDVFLFGSPANADDDYNLSGLTEDNQFSSPDGLFIDHRGLIWIQTDDNALRNITNNQMLVAVPGSVGDGEETTTVTSDTRGDTSSTRTFVGQPAGEMDLKRFLVGPRGCEITGICLTPDARTLFVNIQHPGEGGSASRFNTDESTWPNSSRDATDFGDGTSRPRSATVVITREDGGEIVSRV